MVVVSIVCFVSRLGRESAGEYVGVSAKERVGILLLGGKEFGGNGKGKVDRESRRSKTNSMAPKPHYKSSTPFNSLAIIRPNAIRIGLSAVSSLTPDSARRYAIHIGDLMNTLHENRSEQV